MEEEAERKITPCAPMATIAVHRALSEQLTVSAKRPITSLKSLVKESCSPNLWESEIFSPLSSYRMLALHGAIPFL